MPQQIEYCRCGREYNIFRPHCPRCGSTNCYSKSSNGETVLHNNTRVTIRGFKCRRCGADFNETMACNAPLLATPAEHHTVEVERKATAIMQAIQASGGRGALLKRLFSEEESTKQEANKGEQPESETGEGGDVA